MTMKMEEMATRTIFDCIAVILIASRTAGMYHIVLQSVLCLFKLPLHQK